MVTLTLVLVASLLAFSVFNPATVGGWAIIIIGVVGTLYGARSYARQRTGEVWKETALGYKEEAQFARERSERLEAEHVLERARLETECDEQRSLKHEALTNVAALAAKTDLTAVMEALRSIMETQVAQTNLLGKLVERIEVLSAPRL